MSHTIRSTLGVLSVVLAIPACHDGDPIAPRHVAPLASLVAPASPGAAPFAYVTNRLSNTVSVIATATNTIAATIPVGTNPDGVAITPDGAFVYVADGLAGAVSVIATATNTVVATVAVGGMPFHVAVAPDGGHVYVASQVSNVVSVIETAGNSVVASIPVPSAPTGLAITPDGARIYVSVGSAVAVIATATNAITATIPLSEARGLAVTPDGAAVYVARTCSPGPCSGGFVSVIATATNAVVADVSVASGAFQVAITPNGAFAYVTASGFVFVIATATNTVAANLALGVVPFGVAITPDGAFAYVTDVLTNSVSAIATATNSVVANVAVGTEPRSVAITPQLNTTLEVAIDIKPGSEVNPINTVGRGTIPVAILGTPDFDAPNVVDVASLRFGHSGDELSLAFCSPGAADVNADGRPDLVCHFQVQLTGFQEGDTEGILKGATLQGAAIEGRDGVRIL